MVRIVVVAALAALLSCGYSTHLGDCARISCTAASGCPNGLTCPSDFVCPTVSTTCNEIDAPTPSDGQSGDAAPGTDGHVDAPFGTDAIASVTLPPSQGAATTSDAACKTMPLQPSYRHEWYRLFRPSDFGISGTFNVAGIHFTSLSSTGSPTVTLSVSSYTGTGGPSTLDTSAMTQIGSSMSVSITSDGPHDISFPTTIDPGGAFVVHITGHDAYATQTGALLSSFHLGASASSGTPIAPSYYWSDCSFGESQTEVPESGNDYLISVGEMP